MVIFPCRVRKVKLGMMGPKGSKAFLEVRAPLVKLARLDHQETK